MEFQMLSKTIKTELFTNLKTKNERFIFFKIVTLDCFAMQNFHRFCC